MIHLLAAGVIIYTVFMAGGILGLTEIEERENI